MKPNLTPRGGGINRMWQVLAALYGPFHVQRILRNRKEVCEFVVYVQAFYHVHSLHASESKMIGPYKG
jgi:hypothetical protein